MITVSNWETCIPVYGCFFFFPCLVCASPNLPKVSNSAMMHSTSYSYTYGYRARLNSYGWNPTYVDSLAVLKIDFGSAKKKITAIAVQSGLRYFVSTYELSYSVDGWSWRHWIEHGREKVIKMLVPGLGWGEGLAR